MIALPQMFVGSFEPDDFNGFQTDVQSAFAEFETAGVSQLLVDLTNNGGEILQPCYVHWYLPTARWICLPWTVPSRVPVRQQESR